MRTGGDGQHVPCRRELRQLVRRRGPAMLRQLRLHRAQRHVQSQRLVYDHARSIERVLPVISSPAPIRRKREQQRGDRERRARQRRGRRQQEMYNAINSGSGFTQPAVQAEMLGAINSRTEKVKAQLRVLKGGKADELSCSSTRFKRPIITVLSALAGGRLDSAATKLR